MDQLAKAVADELLDEIGEALIGVAYYSPVGMGVAYLNEEFKDRYPVETIFDEILDDALLESLAMSMYGHAHGEPLRATTRHYDSVYDTAIVIDEMKGIVIGVKTDSEASPDITTSIASRVINSFDDTSVGITPRNGNLNGISKDVEDFENGTDLDLTGIFKEL